MTGPSTYGGPWLAMRPAKPFARMRLFCFPHGGRGASVFRGWQVRLPAEVDVCAVQLPGLENRAAETPYSDVCELALELTRVLRPYFTLPFALFGHGTAAFVAFELARRLCRGAGPSPFHLFVSGQRAPHVPLVLPPIHQMSDDALLNEVARRSDATSAIALQVPELRAMVVGALRADATMDETYVCEPTTPLRCAITCLGGDDDPESGAGDLRRWCEHTTGAFATHVVRDGNFFVEAARTEVLATLVRELEAHASGPSPDAACAAASR